MGIKPFMYDSPNERFNIDDVFRKDPEEITT
jgi:hypothetical protein